MESNTMQWDREKIFDLFAHRTRMEIMSIPLQQNTATRDVLIWKESKSQSFSVKSAYQVVMKMKELTLIEHSTAITEKPLRRKLWKKRASKSQNVPLAALLQHSANRGNLT